jgi:hypothetical protein
MKSRMREFCMSGSVGGPPGDRRAYPRAPPEVTEAAPVLARGSSTTAATAARVESASPPCATDGGTDDRRKVRSARCRIDPHDLSNTPGLH